MTVSAGAGGQGRQKPVQGTHSGPIDARKQPAPPRPLTLAAPPADRTLAIPSRVVVVRVSAQLVTALLAAKAIQHALPRTKAAVRVRQSAALQRDGVRHESYRTDRRPRGEAGEGGRKGHRRGRDEGGPARKLRWPDLFYTPVRVGIRACLRAPTRDLALSSERYVVYDTNTGLRPRREGRGAAVSPCSRAPCISCLPAFWWPPARAWSCPCLTTSR